MAWRRIERHLGSRALLPLAVIATLAAFAAWGGAAGRRRRRQPWTAGDPALQLPVAPLHSRRGPRQGHAGFLLLQFGRRGYVASLLPNTPNNIIHWLQGPQSVIPGVDMPTLNVSDQDARDIPAYLYTLK